MSENYKWWQKTVVYQIYPRSFKDSNGDGIGDLKGIIEKLDYLQNLGVETIWFNPFFESPQSDHGYDIMNFRDIAPEYGTMHDFDDLLKELHARNMKIVLDFVLNHTSINHPWFIESASSKDNPKRNWYIWRDGKKNGGRKPPNNWKTMTGGSAWLYYKNTDQWVYFHFLPSMIDLNYRNPEVKNEMFNTMRFWLNKGVDGFRLDILHAIYEDELLRDDKFSFKLLPSDKSVASLFRAHKYDLNLPETFDFALELRKVINEYKDPDRFLVGEVFGTIEDLKKYYGTNINGLNMIFLFEFTSTVMKFKAKEISHIINRIENTLPYPYTPTYVYGNHDRPRYLKFLKNNIQKAKLLATMQLTLRGVPFIYYGEEIGMFNVKFKLKTSQDPIGRKYAKFPIPQLSKLLGLSLTRDSCRTPMQWNSKNNAGFSPVDSEEPWLKVSDSYKSINVESEEKDKDSLLSCYRGLLKLRKEFITLQEGNFELIKLEYNNEKCLAYRRYNENQELFILLNFSKNRLSLRIPYTSLELLFTTFSNKNSKKVNEENRIIILEPFEGSIYQKI
jgi:oligo-1,6-glucosidase/alpha-glucosidase